MVTTDINQFAVAVDALQQSAAAALEHGSPEDFGAIEQQIAKLDVSLRHLQQAMWSTEARQAARHLEDGKDLTETDLAVIRTFLLANAKRCAQREAEFSMWVEEFSRLMDEVTQGVTALDRESIAELRGALRDLTRLVPDIRQFLEETQRIRQFEAALELLDTRTRETLADILREQVLIRRP